MDKITPVKREKFYVLIKNEPKIKDNQTAQEIAQSLHKKKCVEYGLRQEVQPRITELVNKGVIEVVGSRVDNHTHKKVSVYSLREEK